MKRPPTSVLALVAALSLVLLAYLARGGVSPAGEGVEPAADASRSPASHVATSPVPTPTPSLLAVTRGHTRIEIPADRDTTLYENAEVPLANGAGSYLFVGRTNELVLRRALVRFDVAAHLPAGARIGAAQVVLHLSRTGSGPQSVSLHRVLSDWSEGGSRAPRGEGEGARALAGDATWSFRTYDSMAWTAPGGDFALISSSSTSVDSTGRYVWPSTPELVEDLSAWMADGGSNFGWLLMGNESPGVASAQRFDSRAGGSSGPMLVLDYVMP